jgi:hypothetical protein
MSKSRNLAALLDDSGDVVAEALGNAESGASGTIPFFTANGTQDNIQLSSGSLPFFTASGTQDNIGVS